MKKNLKPFQKLHHYLTPPGFGVFTVHTGQEKRNNLSQIIWGTKNQATIDKKFRNHLKGIKSTQLPMILGICSDTGGGILRGANWGPLFLREHFYNHLTGPISKSYFDLGDIRVVPHLLHDKYLNNSTIKTVRDSIYSSSELPLAVSPLSITEDVTNTIYDINPDAFILGLGGDHSISYPLVKSFLINQKKKKILNETALLHFDAHTDLLSSRLGIDLCFGSWAAHVIPYLSSPANMVQVGIRSSGKDRGHWEKKFGISQIWAKELKKKGSLKIAYQIRDQLIEKGIKEIYLSFDIDVIDSSIVAKTGTPEAGGLFPHEVAMMFEVWSESFLLKGMDIVEVAPFTGPQAHSSIEKDNTLEAAQIILDKAIEWREAQRKWQ